MENPTDYKTAKSIYDFTVQDTHGNDVKLDKYKGNVVLIVNIASQCGLTSTNYAKLTELKKKYYESGKLHKVRISIFFKLNLNSFLTRPTYTVISMQSIWVTNARS